MKAIKTRFFLIVGGLILLFIGFASGFILGGSHGARRVAYAGNASSLVYFTAIHKALEEQDYKRAKMVAAVAVDAHVSVLRQLKTWTNARLSLTLAADGDFNADVTRMSLSGTREYFVKHQDQLRPETMAFLASQP